MPQRKYFVVTRILVFDFELFIGERSQKRKSSQLFQAVNSSWIFLSTAQAAKVSVSAYKGLQLNALQMLYDRR
jgi:hypothetical protein